MSGLRKFGVTRTAKNSVTSQPRRRPRLGSGQTTILTSYNFSLIFVVKFIIIQPVPRTARQPVSHSSRQETYFEGAQGRGGKLASLYVETSTE